MVHLIRKYLVASVLLVLALPSHAVMVFGVNTTITGYYVYDDAAAFIRTAVPQDPQGCGSSVYLYLDTTKANFKAIWAQVIAAHTSGTTVTVLLDGCSGTYPRVRAIAVPESW
jgi:hypothetical protein